MLGDLLQTKLSTPRLRPSLVPRPRLIDKLNQGLTGKLLALISAPAGFGKTTLVAEWLSQISIVNSAWLSLDNADNDPARFLAYVIAALQKILPNLGEGAQAALQSPRPPPVEALLTTLINQINDLPDDPLTASKCNLILVLDDYHLITAKPVHDALAFLLDHLPDNMLLVIVTRSDPPLPLARFRGRGHLTELRTADLRFTLDEAAQFINKGMGLALTAGHLAALTARTEGWIAGLQMAAVSMQSREHDDDITSFIQAFTGSNRYILDYLVEEVLHSQSEEIRDFLLKTAVLDHFTAPLCDAILENAEQPPQSPNRGPRSQEILEQLERANLFIVPLDDRRRWYRYHHLFADLLRNQLNKNYPHLPLALHCRASQWFEQNGFVPEAMQHAIAAEDFNRAADLLESIVSPLLNEGRPATLLSLMAYLPGETIIARPWLAVHATWAYFLTWQFDAIEPLLQSVELNLSSSSAARPSEEFGGANRIHVRMIALRAFMAQWQGDLATATALTHQVLKRLDGDDLQLRSVLETNLGAICMIRGDLTSARQHLEESITAGKAAGNFYAALSSICKLAELDAMQGLLHQAAKTYRQAIQLGLEWGGGRPIPGNGYAHVGLAQVLFEWNDLDRAAHHLTRGIRLGKQCGEREIVMQGYLTLARLRRAQGKTDTATEALEQAAAIAPRESAILPVDFLSSWQARIALAQGDLTAAGRWADSHESALEVSDFLHRFEQPDLILVRVRIAQGRVEEAARLLEQLLSKTETRGHIGNRIIMRILQALTHQAQGNKTQAMHALERALSLAESGGYVRVFVDEGPSMARLLYEAARRGIFAEYASKLLAAFPAQEPAPTYQIRSEEMVEPLSERELEVLQLIAEGLSNQEIATRLVLSLNTIKGHTRKIYNKLGVNSRTQAVAKAKTLGIHFSS